MPEFLLGIDYGTKRIGLSIGQTLTNTAQPLKVLLNDHSLWQELKEIFSNWDIQKIIIGLPLGMDGNEQLITKQTRNFAKKINHKYHKNIEFQDERFSSFEAGEIFKNSRRNKQAKAKHKSQIDAIAAQIILQSWMDTNQQH